MRQLTSLDAQFLAMESARMTGHVGGLAIYDPSTAPGGTLNAPDLCRVIGERLHLLRPFRWRLVDFGIVVDREQAGDAWPILDAVRAALEELDAAVCGSKRPARRASRSHA